MLYDSSSSVEAFPFLLLSAATDSAPLVYIPFERLLRDAFFSKNETGNTHALFITSRTLLRIETEIQSELSLDRAMLLSLNIYEYFINLKMDNMIDNMIVYRFLLDLASSADELRRNEDSGFASTSRSIA